MRASVEIREWTMDTRVPSFPGVYGAIVIPALKGEVNKATLVTSESQLLSDFTPDESIDIGYDSSYYSASAFLVKSNKLWVVRAANNALYGGCLFAQDVPVSTVGVFATNGTNTFTVKHTLAADLAIADSFFSFVSNEKVTLSSDGTLPSGFNDSATYYLINYDPDNYQFRLAYTKEDADNNVFIEFSDNGTGSISLSLASSNTNKSIDKGTLDPYSFMLDTSDGKVSGLSSEFTVDVTRDAFEVSDFFYNTVVTGDTIQLSATVFPDTDLGTTLDGVTIYYLIKDNETEEIKLATTLANAQANVFIPIATTGTDVSGTVTSKAVTGNVSADPDNNNFSVTSLFFDTAETGDIVRLSSTNLEGYPLVTDGGSNIDGDTDFYVIKGTTALQIARTLSGAEAGVAVLFGDAGIDLSMTLTQKSVSSTLEADLSNDILSVDSTFYEWVETGDKVRVSSEGNLPDGLTQGIDYYAVKLDENKLSLAVSPTAIEMGLTVDIKNAGDISIIQNFSNYELLGIERYCVFYYGVNPGAWNEKIYVTSIHYPYAAEENWSDTDREAAELIKEPDCFLLYIYKKNPDNSITLVEDPHLCSRIKGKKDGYGNNIYVEDALLKSEYVRAIDNDGVAETVYPKNQTSILMFNGGDDGNQVTDSDMLTALDPVSNKRNIQVTLLLDGGWATPAYQKQGLISLAENRKDCFAILSCPIASEQSSDYMNAILNYRKYELNANTSYAGLFSSHLQIQDKFNDRKIYVPPDGYVGAVISETAANYEMWYPPAGNRRAILNVLDCVRHFTEGEEDVLYDNGINPIDFYPGRGIRVWGQKTLLSRPSSLDRINVRLLLIVIEPAISEFLEDFLFEINDKLTRALVESGIETYMESIRSRRGVYEFKVVCNDENNKPVDIDAGKLNVWLWIKPVKAAEFIKFTTIITSTGASFTIG